MRTSKFNQKIPSRPEGINKMQTNFHEVEGTAYW